MNAARAGAWLFGISSAFNIGAGLLLFLRPALVQTMLAIPPLEGMAIVFADFCGLLVMLFGLAYACVAYDPVRFRLYIPLGMAGKLSAVVLVWSATIRGLIGFGPSVIVMADLVFVLLFAVYLRRTPAGSAL
jgi:hypothetical protein